MPRCIILLAALQSVLVELVLPPCVAGDTTAERAQHSMPSHVTSQGASGAA